MTVFLALSGCKSSVEKKSDELTQRIKHTTVIQNEADFLHNTDIFQARVLPVSQVLLKYGQTDASSCAELMRVVDAAYDAKDESAAISLAQFAVSKYPNCAKAYYERARGELTTSNMNELAAIADLQKAIELNYRHAHVFKLLGKAYAIADKTDDALKAYNEALLLDPNDSDCHSQKASILLAMNKLNETVDEINEAIELSNNLNPGLYYNRATIRRKLGQPAQALSDYKKTIELENILGKERLSYGAIKDCVSLLQEQNKKKEALEVINEALQKYKTDEDLYRERGKILMSMALYRQAADEFTFSIQTFPEFAAQDFKLRAKCYRQIGKVDLALRDEQRAKEIEQKPLHRGP